MSGENDRLKGQLPLPFNDGQETSSAQRAWDCELGTAVASLDAMMRKPTDLRPFVYEVRFDLLSMGRGVVRLVAKGFGAEGSLITFHDDSSFLASLKGFEGRLRSGKVSWYDDTYTPKNYEKRLELYLSGKVYRVP